MRQLAVIKEVGLGLRDVGHPVLWWTAYIDEAAAALHVFGWKETEEILIAYGVYNFPTGLEGKVCWVEVGDQKITYIEPALVG